MIKTILKRVLVLLTILVILAIGLKIVKIRRAKEAKMPPPKSYPMVVKTITPQIKESELTLPYLAIVENEKSVTLASKVGGRIEMIKKSGKQVQKGEIVAKIDTTQIEANIKALEITLKNAKSTHKRILTLFKAKSASLDQLEQIETKIATLKAKIASLKDNLTYAIVKSPVDGVIAKSFESEGSIAMPGKPLLKIIANSGYYLLVRLPQEETANEIIFKGKHLKLTPLHSTFHGLSEFKAKVDDSSLNLGEKVEIKVVTFRGKAIKLPFDAILNSEGKNYVLIAKNNQATPLQVHIVKKGQEGVVVKENLVGKKVIVAKPDILLRLVSGAKIRIKG